MVSKRVVSTTAEATEMGVYTISLPTKASEECNGQYTNRHGLGEEYNSSTFLEQVSRAIKWNGNRDSVYKSPFNWKDNMLSIITNKLYQSVLARVGVFQFVTGNKQ